MSSNKKFPKKKVVKFRLVPRSQKDPLAADDEAPQNVLVPTEGDAELIRSLNLAPDVFASEREEKVGMLERAHNADGIILDEDIVKAMGPDFKYELAENTIDDDFFQQAGGLIEGEDDGELIGDELSELSKQLFESEAEDSKSVFTDYSMTSSILRKNNEGLQKVDDHFEKLYERYYADDEIGARDMDDIQGEVQLKDPKLIKSMINEVKRVRKKNHGDDYKPEIVSDHHRLAIIGEDFDGEEDLVEMEIRQRENRVDCESILTYNSTLYNHPKLIVEPKRRRNNSRASSNQDQDMMSVDNDDTQSKTDRRSVASSRLSLLSKLSVRPDNETIEQKRARKKALKEFRQERRKERKDNRKIFKLEEKNIIKQHSKVPAMRLA